ncbi:MAG: P-II family nitrogen regulator [Fimbriimonadaceae bacterium]|nr:P-II family nitrogen regulator [Fimbriimonadaceae bacterium]
MKRIQAYIRTNRLEDVLEALENEGILGVSVESTRGYGRQMGQTESFTGSSYAMNLVPKTCLEIVVRDDDLQGAVQAIIESAQTGELGDGKIFVSDVMDAVRIRTGERGDDSL